MLAIIPGHGSSKLHDSGELGWQAPSRLVPRSRTEIGPARVKQRAQGAKVNLQRRIDLSPSVPVRQGLDPFGNIWTRLIARPGRIDIRNEFQIRDSGLPDEVAPDARQWEVDDLPDEVLPFRVDRVC